MRPPLCTRAKARAHANARAHTDTDPYRYAIPISVRHGLKPSSQLYRGLKELPHETQAAFEFRSASWFCDEVYEVLRKKNVALCQAESEKLETPLSFSTTNSPSRRRIDRDSLHHCRTTAGSQ